MYRLIIESSTEKGLIVCAKEKELLFKKEFLKLLLIRQILKDGKNGALKKNFLLHLTPLLNFY